MSTAFTRDEVAAWVIGSTVDIYLYGILTTLGIDYIRNERKAASLRVESGQRYRRRWLLYLVLVVLMLCTLKTAIACYVILCVGLSRDRYADLQDIWPISMSHFLTGLTGLTVQVFYVQRLYHLMDIQTGRLSKAWYKYSLVFTLFIIALISLAFLLVSLKMVFADQIEEFEPFFIVHLGTAFLSDALITSLTVFCMLRMNDRVVNEAKKSILSQIARFTVLSAAIPAFLTLLNLIWVALDWQISIWYPPINFALAKSWSLSLMWTLQYRRRMIMARSSSQPRDHGPHEISLQTTVDSPNTGINYDQPSGFARTVSLYESEHKTRKAASD